MDLYLDKVMTQLAYPLGLGLGLGGLALLAVGLGKRRIAGGLLTFALLWLGVWSLPVVADRIRLSLESRTAEVAVDLLPMADAVVVLGGGMNPRVASGRYPDLGAAADRVWHGARIVHAGKAPVVIVSGGNLPWLGARESEAEAMRTFLSDLSVAPESILLEERSRNTRENALYTAEIMQEHGLETILLVTSALHMPRALAAFQALGLDAVPAATDFEIGTISEGVLAWLPDADALAGSTRALKEYLGYRVYRHRGWVAP